MEENRKRADTEPKKPRQDRGSGSASTRGARADQDSAYKDLLREHFPDFLRFFFPAVADEIDLTKVPVFLDTELKRFSRGNNSPHRLADLLVRVHCKAGGEELIYCHVEVQGHRDEGFELRLLQYAYRILDRLGRLPMTLAVLTDVEQGYPLDGRYRLEPIPGNSLTLEYRVVKLLDLEGRVATVLAEHEAGRSRRMNIFAAVVDLHLRMQRERKSGDWGDDEYRFKLKSRLTKDVVNRYRQDARMVADVWRFLDWLIMLPEELEALYRENVLAMQEDSVVAYVTSWERRSKALGVLQDKQQILELQVSKKFGLDPEERGLIERCTDPERLNAALTTILDATTKDEVLQHIR